MTVPNLDCMDSKDLMAFWSKYKRPNRKAAEALLGEKFPGYTVVVSSLAAYACNKAVAQDCRARGDIKSAEIYDKVCDIIYGDLPESVVW